MVIIGTSVVFFGTTLTLKTKLGVCIQMTSILLPRPAVLLLSDPSPNYIVLMSAAA